MMAECRRKSWSEGWGNHEAAASTLDEAANCADARPAIGRPTCKPPTRQDREGRLVEALLECTTIAGLFALLFALFVLFGAAHTLTS
ncbi:MAG: hypothetical protein ACLGJC_22370 [Alphaproteobacteria bacterium]